MEIRKFVKEQKHGFIATALFILIVALGFTLKQLQPEEKVEEYKYEIPTKIEVGLYCTKIGTGDVFDICSKYQDIRQEEALLWFIIENEPNKESDILLLSESVDKKRTLLESGFNANTG